MIQKTRGIEWWKYYYDFENRLTKVEYFDGQQTTVLGEYFYDGDGKRIKKVESSQTTIYIYIGWSIIYEKEFSTNTETKYIYKADCSCRVAKVVGQVKYYFHVDHLGSLRQMTDTDGNTIWASPIVYDPFGELRSSGSIVGEHTYTGKKQDSTGLYYFGARYYDPKIGRFITKDLWAGNMGMPQTLNDYIFVLNNPLKLMDLIGNSPNCPLCKPNEPLVVPPLPPEHYYMPILYGLAFITGYYLGAYAASWLFGALMAKIYLLKIDIRLMMDKAYTYFMIEFENPGALGGLRGLFARAIVRIRINTMNVDIAMKTVKAFIEFYKENPDLIKNMGMNFLSKEFSSHPQEIIHLMYETALFLWELTEKGWEIVEGWIQEWVQFENGTWGATGRWIHCTGSGCTKGPPLE